MTAARAAGIAPAKAPTLRTDPASDEELVGDVLAGREGSFETLVRRHQQGVHAFLLRMVRDPDEAADLAQEVFLKVFAGLEQFNPAFRFRTWLYRIAANAAVDRSRRRRSAGRPVEIDGEPAVGARPLTSTEPGPEEFLAARETRDRLEAALREVPAPYREVFIMRYRLDMPYGEIALAARLPLGTVKNRIFRAREMLKRALR